MEKEFKKQILYTILLAAGVIAAFLGILWVRGNVVKERTATIGLFKKLASIEMNKIAFLEESNQFTALKADVASIESLFYDSKTIPLFLSELEGDARALGAEFEIATVNIVSNNAATGPYVSVEFRAKGSYDRMIALAEKFETKPSRIIFEKFYLIGPAAGAAQWELYGTLRLVTFNQ